MSDPVDPKRVPRPLRSALRAEREATIARLQDAVAADHLELDELEERLDLAMTASTSDELSVLVRDLPDTPPSPTTLAAIVPVMATAPVPALPLTEPEPIALSAIFSGHQLEGRRFLPRALRVRALFGGVDLDLREATFLPGTTTIHCKATFGGVDIKVPPHVRVECLGSGIFGAFHADTREGADDALDAPVLRIVGRAVFGGVHAQRRRVIGKAGPALAPPETAPKRLPR
ncbi:MAG: DUF1707 domain-containing protein [Deltaproteobacteria bacterium]|nr:DUF1707 domain-containing protein [Deltaproteobacteria bacterium]